MSAATANMLEHNDITLGERSGGKDVDEEELTQQYHIEVPQLLPGTALHQVLWAENAMLCDIIAQAGIALEQDFAQMKLMELE